MGQKQIVCKNFRFPKDCIGSNTVVVGQTPLQGIANHQHKIQQANYKCQPTLPMIANPAVNNLTFLTYNVWFEWQNEQNRVPCLLSLLETSNADFICLQEVTAAFMKELLSCQWMAQKYVFSGYAMNGYDSLILSKFNCQFYRICFQNTTMGRSLYIADTVVNGKHIAVATSHFESLDNSQRRKEQLAIAFKALEAYDDALLMGDFNFDSTWNNEEKVIPPEYRDVWIDIKKINTWTMPQTDRYSAWRPDRILIKSKNWKAVAVDRVGDFSIPPYEHQQLEEIVVDGRVRTPSDHMGLACKIQQM